MLRLAKFAMWALVAALIAVPANARDLEWVELGEHKVALFETDDEVKVGREDGVFTKIRLEVYGNDLDIRYIKVRFLNGEEQRIDIDSRIRQGRSTPEYDLVGRRRGIASIFLRYNGRPIFGGKSRVKIFAERSDFDDRRRGPPPALAGRPAILDTASVDDGSDRIEFDVGREDGMITQIRLRAVDAPLLYRAIEITFGNGQTQTVDGIERLMPGEQGKAIDLEGDRRFIRKVVVYKRPSWRRENGSVELLGLVQPRPAPPPPPPPARPRPSADGFDVIDEQVVDRRSETVEFDVPRGDGPFSAIKLKALDDAVLIRRVEIISRGGQTQTLDLIERLQEGEESPSIDVEGRGKIEKVIVTKRPSWRAGQSRLQLAGLEQRRREPPREAARPSRGPRHGFPPGWVLIGLGDLAVSPSVATRPAERTGYRTNFNLPPMVVTQGPTTATIPIGGREVGQFKAIGLRLIGGSIKINKLTVVYGNRENDTVVLSTDLSDGSRTQPIDLKGERFIRELVVEYIKLGSDQTTMEIYGDYADDWISEGGRRRNFNQGWVLLGAQRAQMLSTDIDDFQVGERFGKFRSVKIAARDQPVRIYGLRVVYGNGETEDVAFSGELTSGQSSPPLDLQGRRRFIDRIDVKYRTKLNFKGDGVVEVWGQQ